MPAKVILKVVEGPLTGQQFAFDEPASCILGRSPDCVPVLPSDKAHETVSRHHCLLEINPPDVRIRDFGSMNGTHVNGKNIGQRERGSRVEDAKNLILPEHDLKNGDEIRLGVSDSLIRITVVTPARCQGCTMNIPEDQLANAERSTGVFFCNACWEKAKQAPLQANKPGALPAPANRPPLGNRPAAPPAKPSPPVALPAKPVSPPLIFPTPPPIPAAAEKRCARCGTDVSAQVGALRDGEFVCERCKGNLMDIASEILQVETSIHGYTLVRELGKGGMGAVYLAQNTANNEYVALKVMLPRVAVEPRAKMAFLREIENTAALKHQNIVAFRNSGCSSGSYYFALEFCNCGSVDKLMLSRGGKLSVDEAAPIICEVLDALEYAHNAHIPSVRTANGSYAPGQGLIHRDLTPHNILLHEEDGMRTAKIADFGLSKAFNQAGMTGFTRTGDAAGKPLYMPRQQVVNFKYAQPDVDVWAAAATLYAMLTGCPPRDFPQGKDVWQFVLQANAVPIRERDPAIPAKVAEVIDTALKDAPDIYFKTAAEFKKALMKAL
ncbi:MAG: protein kinase [Verrucomicrobiota bacterium]